MIHLVSDSRSAQVDGGPQINVWHLGLLFFLLALCVLRGGILTVEMVSFRRLLSWLRLCVGIMAYSMKSVVHVAYRLVFLLVDSSMKQHFTCLAKSVSKVMVRSIILCFHCLGWATHVAFKIYEVSLACTRMVSFLFRHEYLEEGQDAKDGSNVVNFEGP